MSQFTSSLQWKRDQANFELRTFNRNHIIRFPNGTVLEGSSAPDFSGNPERNNPEQLFVASLFSCHMLTFLAMAAIGKWKVESYEDEAKHFQDGHFGIEILTVLETPVSTPYLTFSLFYTDIRNGT